jgi:NTE family protein
VEIFSGSQRIARYSLRTINGEIDVGANLGPFLETRLGILSGTLNANLDTGPEALSPPGPKTDQGAIVLRGITDQLDSANFPRTGYQGSANLFASRQSLGATDDYTKWDADLLGAFSIARHTLSVGLKGGGTIGNGDLPRYDLFQWGGFLQQSGYPIGALLGERLTFGRLVYTYKLVDQKFFEGMYVGGSLEAGRMDKPLIPGNFPGLLKSASVFIAFDSPIGPLYLALGRAADGNRSGYLYLGRP